SRHRPDSPHLRFGRNPRTTVYRGKAIIGTAMGKRETTELQTYERSKKVSKHNRERRRKNAEKHHRNVSRDGSDECEVRLGFNDTIVPDATALGVALKSGYGMKLIPPDEARTLACTEGQEHWPVPRSHWRL